MNEEKKKNNFVSLGSWKNIEITKWKNEDDKISYSVKVSYKKGESWDSKSLTIFPGEVLDLKKAMEIIEKDMFDFIQTN